MRLTTARGNPRISALILVALLLIPLADAFAFNLSLNGAPRVLPSETALERLLYVIPSGEKELKGISLAELLPSLIRAWNLTCETDQGRSTWTDDGIADRLSETYLIAAGKDASGEGAWDLLTGTTLLKGIRSISLQGDIAQERDLEVWISWEGTRELKAEIERWASLTGAGVRTVDVPDTRSKLLAVLRGGGRVPDLFMIQSDNVPDLAAARAIQPLDRIGSAALDPKGAEAFRADGKLWALPFYFDTQLLFYRKRTVARAPRLDWTTDELETLAASLSVPGRPALSWNIYSAYWLLPFALGFGKPSIADADGGVRPDDAGTRAALDWMLAMIGKGIVDPLERDGMIARFASGEVPLILSGSYSIPEFERIGLDFGAAPYPVVSATGKPVSPLLDFKGFAMGKATRSPVSSRRLLEYLTGIGVQQRFIGALSKLPANADVWSMLRKTNSYYPQLSRSREIGSVIPPSSGYAVYKNTMWKIIRFILTGAMSTEKALGEATRLIDANLAPAR